MIDVFDPAVAEPVMVMVSPARCRDPWDGSLMLTDGASVSTIDMCTSDEAVLPVVSLAVTVMV